MDLETENRIAMLLMEEAAKLRVQAEKEGIYVYLRQPQVRLRPNSRFLTATVRGVQQANRAVEVNEMWRIRQKELELEDKLKGGKRDRSKSRDTHTLSCTGRIPQEKEVHENLSYSCISNKHSHEDCNAKEDAGLRDEEIEEFLHSRVKRGRGAVGSRMNEPGPYLPSSVSEGKLAVDSIMRVEEEWERRVLGPERPPFMELKSCAFEDDDKLLSRSKKKAKTPDEVNSKPKSKHRKKHKSSSKERREKSFKSKCHRSRR